MESRARGPDATERERGKSFCWARATGNGVSVEARLEMVEGYQFTASSAVSAVDRVLKDGMRGALPPALAFGPDFVLTVPGTRRLEALA